jgi:hypothetical protein
MGRRTLKKRDRWVTIRVLEGARKHLEVVPGDSYDDKLNHLMKIHLWMVGLDATQDVPWPSDSPGRPVTLRIREETLERLRALKASRRETYSEVIARLRNSYYEFYMGTWKGRVFLRRLPGPLSADSDLLWELWEEGKIGPGTRPRG